MGKRMGGGRGVVFAMGSHRESEEEGESKGKAKEREEEGGKKVDGEGGHRVDGQAGLPRHGVYGEAAVGIQVRRPLHQHCHQYQGWAQQ